MMARYISNRGAKISTGSIAVVNNSWGPGGRGETGRLGRRKRRGRRGDGEEEEEGEEGRQGKWVRAKVELPSLALARHCHRHP